MKNVRLNKRWCHGRKKEQKIENNKLYEITHKNALL